MWNKVRRWAGTLLAGALGGFTLLFAYWAAGGAWGIEYMWGGPNVSPQAAWLLWTTACCLAGWTLIVLGATNEWGSPRTRRFFKVGCWVIAVTFLSLVSGSLKEPAGTRERLVFAPALLLSLAAAAVAYAPRKTRRRMFP